MRFWDSSAIVPLLVQEAPSPAIRALYDRDPVMLAWWGTQVECSSALARLERERLLSSTAAATAFRRLGLLRQNWHEVQPVDELRESALRFLRVHELRAGDAFQLAAAFLAAERRPPTLDFVCLDERLSLAAQREGFTITEVPPVRPIRES